MQSDKTKSKTIVCEETIRDIAIELMASKWKCNSQLGCRSTSSLFVLGSKATGKTTAINKFLDREDSYKETLSLEYTFGRKNGTGQFIEKNVCHIWELGGDTQISSDVVCIPLQASNALQLTLVIMLDLTHAASLWVTLESCIYAVQAAIASHNIQQLQQSQNYSFPFPVLLVGGKYDIFKTMDSNYKKKLCTKLRSVAIFLGAGLIFYSNNDQMIIKKWKDILNYFGFGIGSAMKGLSVDFNKPLYITAGLDSWENLGVLPHTWDTLRTAFITQFPQLPLSTAIPDDPSLEPSFRDPLVDSLRIQKDDQLKLLMLNSLQHQL